MMVEKLGAKIKDWIDAMGLGGMEMDFIHEQLGTLLRGRQRMHDRIDKLAGGWHDQRRELRRIVRDCGGRLSGRDLNAIEDDAGITREDIRRWDKGDRAEGDLVKQGRARMLLRRFLKRNLTGDQFACVRRSIGMCVSRELRGAFGEVCSALREVRDDVVGRRGADRADDSGDEDWDDEHDYDDHEWDDDEPRRRRRARSPPPRRARPMPPREREREREREANRPRSDPIRD